MRLTSRRQWRQENARNSPVLRGGVIAGILVCLAVTFRLDSTTGAAPFQHLYYVPIILAAVTFGTWAGAGVAVAAIALYHIANPQLLVFHHEQSDIVQVLLFAAIGFVAGKLTDDARRFRRLAMTDDLTGLHNLRSFERAFITMIRDARERAGHVGVLVLDVDRLKSLNDTRGHLAGAEAVRTVGHVIGVSVPADAVACRYGGDEFVVAIPNCDRTRASEVANALRSAVSSTAPTLAGVRMPSGTLTISVGVASQAMSPLTGPDDTDERVSESLFTAADRALYAAKAAGRNAVQMSA